MTSKIRIKLGAIEVEYEGPEEFLRKELPDLLQAVSTLYHESQSVEPDGNGSTAASESGGGEDGVITGATTTLAHKLGCKTGSDVAIAAAARLSLGLQKHEFSRADLLSEMKKATNHYKKTYANNLTSILQTLQSQGKFIQPRDNTYALNADTAKDLRQRLAS